VIVARSWPFSVRTPARKNALTQGEALFGYGENRDRLAAGALPVIVEGPMDAYAITLATAGTAGTAVGLAPMGTALTTEQIKLLLHHINLETRRDQIAVAYDNDTAGWKAARTAFWHLTSADLDPTVAAGCRRAQPALVGRLPRASRGSPGGDRRVASYFTRTGRYQLPRLRAALPEIAAEALTITTGSSAEDVPDEALSGWVLEHAAHDTAAPSRRVGADGTEPWSKASMRLVEETERDNELRTVCLYGGTEPSSTGSSWPRSSSSTYAAPSSRWRPRSLPPTPRPPPSWPAAWTPCT
jgi:hypothetical protein